MENERNKKSFTRQKENIVIVTIVAVSILLITFGIYSIIKVKNHNNTRELTGTDIYKIGDNLSFIKTDLDYSDYYINSKNTRIHYSENSDFNLIIENEMLFLKYNDVTERVNINGEIPKYVVSYYVHCGGATFRYYVLTENGSVYYSQLDFLNDDNQSVIDKLKNPLKYDSLYVAKELILKSSSHIDGPTCVNPNVLILTEDNELREISTGKKYNEYPTTFDGFIKYASNDDTNSSAGNYIGIHDDGTIRDVSLENNFTMKVSGKNITNDSDESILFNYFLSIENNGVTSNYVIDQLGSIYLLNKNSNDFITVIERYNDKIVTQIVKNNYNDSSSDLEIRYSDGSKEKFVSSDIYNSKVLIYTANNPNKNIWEKEWLN